MELCDFAGQVLFATTLEEKLRRPDCLTDSGPGSALSTAVIPGRPDGLRFKNSDARKVEFPRTHKLDQESERAALLHFLANHELLATELMALALLRFPDAPTAFRQGVAETLQDEQIHARLYIERMRDCGMHFGALPVSGYLWRTISNMKTPLEFVSLLSLTFEQANLDFCRYFARAFSKVGDAATARLLDRIYRDEIGHVAHGLKWFRQWKNPEQSDWDAFCQQLEFPLSPQRAKGLEFNEAGRRAAGLDRAYIERLSVFSQSKGRTPSVFLFNPFAEGRLGEGPGFNPGKQQRLLGHDLENLPQFLCRQDDIVLVSKHPSVNFLSGLKDAGFPLPEFVELKDGKIDATSAITRRKLGGLHPWAWGADSLELLEPLFKNVTGEHRTAGARFNDGFAELYSKAWSATFLVKVLERAGGQSWLCPSSVAGRVVDTRDAALDAVETIRRQGHHRVVVKRTFGLAGQNMLRLWEPTVLDAQRRWLENGLRRGGALVIEPWLDRVLDFSIQLEGGKIRGYTGLINDSRGQFQANWAEPNSASRLPAKVLELFRHRPGVAEKLHAFFGQLVSTLAVELVRRDVCGPVGIDAFVYRTAQGDVLLKPIVEINPRYTMGRLTLELMKRTAPGSSGVFQIMNRAAIRRRGFPDFSAYAQDLQKQFPLRLEGLPVLKIREGALCLNDPSEAAGYLAIFKAGRLLDTLM
ncbi:MAG: hypothetical protein QOF48_1035 [Verrucomicrobiota bacterium]|jgi:uncharacterized ferritin-like protein (DUF455 family)